MTASDVKTAPVINLTLLNCPDKGCPDKDDMNDDSLVAVKLDRTAIWLDQIRGARQNGVGKKLAVLLQRNEFCGDNFRRKELVRACQSLSENSGSSSTPG